MIKYYLKAKLKISVYNLVNYLIRYEMQVRMANQTFSRYALGLQIYSVSDLSLISKLFISLVFVIWFGSLKLKPLRGKKMLLFLYLVIAVHFLTVHLGTGNIPLNTIHLLNI